MGHPWNSLVEFTVLWLRVLGFGFRVQGLRVQGLGASSEDHPQGDPKISPSSHLGLLWPRDRKNHELAQP